MKPIEQPFDFTKDAAIQETIPWITAVSKIPLQEASGFTFADTIKALAKSLGLEYIQPAESSRSEFVEMRLENGFFLDTGWFEDQNVSKEDHCFGICFYPFGGEWEVYVYFERNGSAIITDQSLKYPDLFQKMGTENGQTMTWQAAHGLLCAFARYEQSGVPTCTVH